VKNLINEIANLSDTNAISLQAIGESRVAVSPRVPLALSSGIDTNGLVMACGRSKFGTYDCGNEPCLPAALPPPLVANTTATAALVIRGVTRSFRRGHLRISINSEDPTGQLRLITSVSVLAVVTVMSISSMHPDNSACASQGHSETMHYLGTAFAAKRASKWPQPLFSSQLCSACPRSPPPRLCLLVTGGLSAVRKVAGHRGWFGTRVLGFPTLPRRSANDAGPSRSPSRRGIV